MENSIKVDVGVSAKAELKAEVPTSSMGRLVDALTDAIRPFTERRGLRGDLIRLQREDVLIEIARRARNRLALDSATAQPVPNRLLIPLLEKASWTDPEDQVLVETWANLLVDVSVHPNPNHAIAVDLLSKLDALHVRILNKIITNPRGRHFEDVPMNYDEDSIRESIVEIIKESQKANDIDIVNDRISETLDVKGVSYTAGGLHVDDGEIYEFDAPEFIAEHERAQDALVSLNILREYFIRNVRFGHYSVWVHYYALTSFGVEFVQACTSANHEE